MKLGIFSTDAKKETGGAWVTLAKGTDGEADLRIKLARLGNTDHEAYQRELMRSRTLVARIGDPTPAEERTMAKDAIAACILLDWEGLQDESGDLIPFSKTKARELFDSHPDFYKVVLTEANNVTHFR